MIWLRRMFWAVFAGALLGVVAASFIAPPYLAWDNTPRNGQALCNCLDVVENTTRSLLKAQALGGAIGAGFALLLLVFFAFARRTTPSQGG